MSSLSLPAAADDGWRVTAGPRGRDLLLLLGRDTPFPQEMRVETMLGTLPRQSFHNPATAVWYANWEPHIVGLERASDVATTAGHVRGIDVATTVGLDDPELQLHRVLQARLATSFPYSLSVSIPTLGSHTRAETR